MKEREIKAKVPTPEECRKLYDTQRYYDIWYGACRLALSLQGLIDGCLTQDRKINNTKFINSLLDFLLANKSDMLTYILNSGGSGVAFKAAPMRDKKGRSTKQWKVYKLIYPDGITPEIAGTEFISENEYRWRETARIFMEALNEACITISVLTGKPQNEVFNRLIKGQTIATPEDTSSKDKPLITESPVGTVKISKSDIPRGKEQMQDIILDFYSGSATTAHAVMQLNAETGKGRRYIMVQSAEPCGEKTEAYKAGYSTIAEIGKERIRRAAKKIAKEHPEADFDGGFQSWKIGDCTISRDEQRPKCPDTCLCSRAGITSFVLQQLGLPADYPIAEMEVLGGRFWSVDGGRIILSDEAGVTVEQAKAVCDMQPERIVLCNATAEVISMVGKYLEVHEQMKFGGKN